MSYVVTISRQFGSMGAQIAKLTAERLNIEFLDKRIIERIAEETGIEQEHIDAHHKHGEKFWQRNKMLFNFSSYDLNQQIYRKQKEIIREHAAAHSCLILGRSADAVLADFPQVLNVYIFAPLAFRCRNIQQFYELSEDDALAAIKRVDAQRSDYRNFFGHNIDRRQLLLDSSCFGQEGCVSMIAAAVKTLFNEN